MQSIGFTQPLPVELPKHCPTCGKNTTSPGMVWVEGDRVLCLDEYHIYRQVEEAAFEAAGQVAA